MEMNVSKTYSFAGNRYELIKGKIFEMTAAPFEKHQSLLGDLYFWVKNFFLSKKRKCKIYPAPFDVRLPKNPQDPDNKIYTVVQPDIVVVCDASKIDKRGCLGVPDLVVEVLSPSTAKKDLNEKFNLYEEVGIKEYWVVFPDSEQITIYLRGENGLYDEGTEYTMEGNKILKSTTLEGLEIDLACIFGQE
jgi:Uma2 family endonuclease